MGSLSPGRMLAAFEAWVTGYRSEHYKLGLQMGTALIIGLLPVLIDQWYNRLDRGGSTLYTAVTVAVVLEPSTGDAFRKIAKRLLGAGLAGGLALLVLFLAIGHDQYSPKYERDGYQAVLARWVVPACAILGFVFMVNHQRFWRHHEFWATAMFALPIIMLPAIRSIPENYYRGAAYRMLNVCLGIVIAAVVSFVLFPVRARGLLQKKMASTLIKVGDLAVWVVGQVCVLPQPGARHNIPGASGTDETFTYRDDGLHAKMQPLMQTASELTSDLAYMGKLLEAASAEFYIVRAPHTFPTKQYKMLLDSCHVVLGIFLSLIYAMEGNTVSLHVCQRHIGDLSECGVRLSAAFTALSTLIRPPKSKKKKWWQVWKKAEKRRSKRGQKGSKGGKAAGGRGSSANGLASGAADAAAATAAALEQEQQRRALGKAAAAAAADGMGTPHLAVQQQQQQPQQPQHGGSGSDSDDPFAGLADGPPGAAVSTPPVVALTDSELHAAQVMARHLSMVADRRSMRFNRFYDELAADDATPLSPLEEAGSLDTSISSPLAPQPGGSKGSAAAAAAAAADDDNDDDAAGAADRPAGAGGKNADMERTSMGLTGLSSIGAGGTPQQRREWVLHKLCGLVDAVKQLEVAAFGERSSDATQAGLPAFMLVVHACVNLTRQCGTCLTALDPEHGQQLHAYYLSAREAAAASRGLSSAATTFL